MLRFLLLLPLVLVAAGCGVTKASLLGDYTGTFNLSEEQKKNPATAFLDGMKPKLTLKDDDTFVLDLMVKTEGTWRFEGGKVFLKPTTVMGVAIPESQQREMQFAVQDRGKRLEGINPEGDVPLTFVKAES
ncbi:MAG: hypothetical protein KatS3mg015_1689 [Fimbriimonadales bacterium]|jgi:hypothetical protein|nr:MAG: hypothetical protein KatS3mg015_1689 [Fimbriimonadales bacterium]